MSQSQKCGANCHLWVRKFETCFLGSPYHSPLLIAHFKKETLPQVKRHEPLLFFTCFIIFTSWTIFTSLTIFTKPQTPKDLWTLRHPLHFCHLKTIISTFIVKTQHLQFVYNLCYMIERNWFREYVFNTVSHHINTGIQFR